MKATFYGDCPCYETAMMSFLFPLRDQCDQVLMINHGRVILWWMFMRSRKEQQDILSHPWACLQFYTYYEGRRRAPFTVH